MTVSAWETVIFAAAVLAAGVGAQAQPVTFDVELTARGECRDQVAQVPMDFVQMRKFLDVELPPGEWDARVVDLETGESALSQTDPELDDEGNAVRGTVYWLIAGQHPVGTVRRYQVTMGLPRQARLAEGITVDRTDQEIVVKTPHFLAHHPLAAGGMLADVNFGGEAGRMLPLRMNDRLYDKELGRFSLRLDQRPQVDVLRSGPLMVIVRTTARYCDGNGKAAPGEPQATYTFAYSTSSPTVEMIAQVRQQDGPTWGEMHAFEMSPEPIFFNRLAASPPLESRELVAEKKTHSLRGKSWGAVFNERDALALIGPALYGIHANVPGNYVYVHGPWRRFDGGDPASAGFKATLYLGPSGGSAEELAGRIERLRGGWETRVELPHTTSLVDEPVRLRGDLEEMASHIRGRELRHAVRRLVAVGLWLTDSAERAGESLTRLDEWHRLLVEAAGVRRNAEILAATVGSPPLSPRAYADDETVVLAGDGIVLRLRQTDEGMGLAQIAQVDQRTGFLAAADEMNHLWSLVFRNVETNELARVAPGDATATRWECHEENGRASLEMTWEGCSVGDADEAVDVTVTVSATNDSSLTRWRLRLKNRTEGYGLWEMHFPRIGPIGPRGHVCVPRKWGTVYEVPLTGSDYRGTYPSGGCFGQLVCYWRGQSGLYLGAHDGSAGVKELSMVAEGTDCVKYELNTFPSDMGVLKPERDLGYDFIIGAYRGDWFEAAKIYRAWATKQFWCRRGPIGDREDMPQWWKDCSLCFRPTGDPADVASRMKKLQAAFGMPAVCHWYTWHQIPFDNDYPEYFPVKPGFKEAVAEAQSVGVHIMPYINGHIWDTDTKSWEEENGHSGACLQTDGSLYIERWSKQEHAVMCPHSQLWQRKMREIAVRLVDEYGVKGLYLDQIGAAGPQLCFSPDHGHPLGGGDFWSRGYDVLLEELRTAAHAIDPEFIMTTESHAEPYIAQLDGHLMCNLVGANQVPLYSAIYGGYTQTFGRSGETGNPTAFRMEHGQAFAFGSMMGRISRETLLEPENAELLAYLKSLAEMRRDYRDFMAFGEMLGPPELEGDIPTVETQWASKTRDYVEMDAIQRSAWRARDGRVGLFFTNVAGEPVEFAYEFTTEDLGLRPRPGQRIEVAIRTTGEPGAEPGLEAGADGPFRLEHSLQPMETMAVVISVE